MEWESPNQVTTPAGAAFLSYASEDAEAAALICDSLRAAGIEVWFDQSELRGGDAWDRQIREQINECGLFVPVISANAHARTEGYFRLEWKLAIDRSHRMAPDQAFLLPVVIDDTPQGDKRIPDRFRELQWTRVPGGETPRAFIDRVRRLLASVESDTSPAPRRLTGTPTEAEASQASNLKRRRSGRAALAAAVVVGTGVAVYIAHEHLSGSKQSVSSTTAATVPASAVSAAFNPPVHSIAVLPFVNMSADKEQEYFSDGLTEELLNSLSRINKLQVAGRTSSFYFKGKDVDLGTIAHKLNVGAILEGSVRRSSHTVRVTTQLINTVTGFHLWSETYDRDLGDVLKLQTEIATAVANALKITLLGDLAPKIEVGGTRNPAAFEAYVRALKIHYKGVSSKDEQAAIDGFTQALRLDPDYALAYAGRSLALRSLVGFYATTAVTPRASIDRSLADAHKTVALAPDIAEGHLALAFAYETSLDFTRASEEYKRALTLGPGNARVLRDYGNFAISMGRSDVGLAMLRRAAVLDPLNYVSHMFLGGGLQSVRRYHEAIGAFGDAVALAPDASDARTQLGVTQYLLGDPEAARSSCDKADEEYDYRPACMAMAYHKLGRDADAQTALANLKARWGDNGPTVYAQVYAQWGDARRALESLDAAVRLRSPGLEGLKTDPLLDPVRNERRFQAIEKALKFPE